MTLPTVVMSEEGTLAKKFLSQTVNMFVCCQVGCFNCILNIKAFNQVAI